MHLHEVMELHSNRAETSYIAMSTQPLGARWWPLWARDFISDNSPRQRVNAGCANSYLTQPLICVLKITYVEGHNDDEATQRLLLSQEKWWFTTNVFCVATGSSESLSQTRPSLTWVELPAWHAFAILIYY